MFDSILAFINNNGVNLYLILCLILFTITFILYYRDEFSKSTTNDEVDNDKSDN